jgi:hypothetical protein
MVRREIDFMDLLKFTLGNTNKQKDPNEVDAWASLTVEGAT